MTRRPPARALTLGIGAVLTATVLAGCAAHPPKPAPGSAAVVLDVTASPRAGAKPAASASPKTSFPHVPVYDASPAAARLASASASMSGTPNQYERVDYGALGDIIVWLEPEPAARHAEDRVAEATWPMAPLVLDIDPANPSATVHAASVGQPVVFRNASPRPISPYSVSDGNDFEVAEIAPGGEGQATPAGEGLIEILFDPGQPPVALIYAAPSPWVARARSGTKVVFDDVTPGSYRAISWHPRLPGASAELQLTPDQVTRATLGVGVKDLPETP